MNAGESWAVLDLDTPGGGLRSAEHLAYLFEYQEPSQAIDLFRRLCGTEHVRTYRRMFDEKSLREPEEALSTPNPHFGVGTCTWELIQGSSQMALWDFEATPLVRRVPARWVVCVGTRYPDQGARIWPRNVGPNGRVVTTILFRVPDESSPEARELRALRGVEYNRIVLTKETCLDCQREFFWHDRRGGASFGFAHSFSPVCFRLALEPDLVVGCEEWEAAKSKHWGDLKGKKGRSARVWGLTLEGSLTGILMGKRPMPKEWKDKIGRLLCWECERKLSNELVHIWSH